MALQERAYIGGVLVNTPNIFNAVLIHKKYVPLWLAQSDNKMQMLFYKYNINVGIRDWVTKQKLIMERYTL